VRVAVPVVKAKGDYFLVPHFGRAPSFAIVEVEGGSYRVVEVFDNPHATHDHGGGWG
jgi:predicted Fe-Mo cluster-binding NifX family protein